MKAFGEIMNKSVSNLLKSKPSCPRSLMNLKHPGNRKETVLFNPVIKKKILKVLKKKEEKHFILRNTDDDSKSLILA